MYLPANHQSLERIGRTLTNLRIDTALLALHLAAKANFNPNQPRVQAGKPHGGQWTRLADGTQRDASRTPARTLNGTGFNQTTHSTITYDNTGNRPWAAIVANSRVDGTIVGQNVINRDGTFIRSEFASASDNVSFDERHTVVGPEGVSITFENAGPDQLVYDGGGELLARASWMPGGPQPEIFRPDLLGPDVGDDGSGAPLLLPLLPLGLVLYDWLTSVDGAGEQTVVSFSAREYVRGAGQTFALDSVRSLQRGEVDDFCPRYGEVQIRTDEAVDTVLLQGATNLSPQALGTAVHLQLKLQIDRLNDPAFRAEVSALKSLNEVYGRKDSVRVDVFEKVDNETVCIYDIKTGKGGLRSGRMAEIATKVLNSYPTARRIIVTEVRPTR